MRSARTWIAVLLCLALPALPLEAQQTPSAASSLPAYRPPALALVQPAGGGSVPHDKAIIVFRFAPGEPNDPIDARSFSVTIDGADQTARFQVTATEAWGVLADSGDAISTTPRQVSARICSTRGACGEVSATVAILESASVAPAPTERPSGARLWRIMEAIAGLIRRLLGF